MWSYSQADLCVRKVLWRVWSLDLACGYAGKKKNKMNTSLTLKKCENTHVANTKQQKMISLVIKLDMKVLLKVEVGPLFLAYRHLSQAAGTLL